MTQPPESKNAYFTKTRSVSKTSFQKQLRSPCYLCLFYFINFFKHDSTLAKLLVSSEVLSYEMFITNTVIISLKSVQNVIINEMMIVCFCIALISSHSTMTCSFWYLYIISPVCLLKPCFTIDVGSRGMDERLEDVLLRMKYSSVICSLWLIFYMRLASFLAVLLCIYSPLNVNSSSKDGMILALHTCTRNRYLLPQVM